MGSTHGEAAGVPPAGPPLRFAFLRRGGLGWAVTCPDLCPRLSVSIGNHLRGRCFGEAEQDGPCMRTGALVCPPRAPGDGWCWALGTVLSTSSCRDITRGMHFGVVPQPKSFPRARPHVQGTVGVLRSLGWGRTGQDPPGSCSCWGRGACWALVSPQDFALWCHQLPK